MNVIVVLIVCVIAAILSRALQTRFFPKTVPDPKDYAEHAKLVAIYSCAFVVASAISYVIVPMVDSKSPNVPSVQQLNAMMRDRVSDVPVPAITKVV